MYASSNSSMMDLCVCVRKLSHPKTIDLKTVFFPINLASLWVSVSPQFEPKSDIIIVLKKEQPITATTVCSKML